MYSVATFQVWNPKDELYRSCLLLFSLPSSSCLGRRTGAVIYIYTSVSSMFRKKKEKNRELESVHYVPVPSTLPSCIDLLEKIPSAVLYRHPSLYFCKSCKLVNYYHSRTVFFMYEGSLFVRVLLADTMYPGSTTFFGIESRYDLVALQYVHHTCIRELLTHITTDKLAPNLLMTKSRNQLSIRLYKIASYDRYVRTCTTSLHDFIIFILIRSIP